MAAEDDMVGVAAGSGARNKAKDEGVGGGEMSLVEPLGEFGSVVFHFGSKNGSTLVIEDGAPIHSNRAARVEFVESADSESEVLAALVANAIDGTSNNESDAVGKSKATIAISARDGAFGINRVGVGVEWQERRRRIGLEAEKLLLKVGVDASGFKSKRGRSIDVGSGFSRSRVGRIVARRFVGSFMNGLKVELGIASFVDENDAVLNSDDQIPGVERALRSHEHGQNRIGDKDLSLSFRSQRLQDGILG